MRRSKGCRSALVLRIFSIVCLLHIWARCQVSAETVVFADSLEALGIPVDGSLDDDQATQARFGLLASLLDKRPTGGELNEAKNNNNNNNNNNKGNFCCCMGGSAACPVPRVSIDPPASAGSASGSGGFLSAIRPRGDLPGDTPEEDEGPETETPSEDDDDDYQIVTRIINDPLESESKTDDQQVPPSGCQNPTDRPCCYGSVETLNSVGGQCNQVFFGGVLAGKLRPATGPPQPAVPWQQRCPDHLPGLSRGGKQCGERRIREVASGIVGAQARLNEFPWTCLVLNQNNDFLGTCAVVPDNINNDIEQGTDRVITAAHKLAKVKPNEVLKVRVLEYDANGFAAPEVEKHEEYLVLRKRDHPLFDASRLSYDLTVLHLDRRINLRRTDGVNAACLPQCGDMFGFRFPNGTGVRCWVAGWGKNGTDGRFQFVINKVDLPIVERSFCEGQIKRTLSAQRPEEVGSPFFLSPSEMCAGGEERKDACEGDGGAPLVCESNQGRWTVVGLVTWGIGCGTKDLPGVYADVYHMKDFIFLAS